MASHGAAVTLSTGQTANLLTEQCAEFEVVCTHSANTISVELEYNGREGTRTGVVLAGKTVKFWARPNDFISVAKLTGSAAGTTGGWNVTAP